MTKRSLGTAALLVVLTIALLGCGLLGDDAAQVTATPTRTLRPLFTSTFTPMPSPLPTDTIPPPATEVVASDTPPPTNTALPTDAATAEVPPTEMPPTEVPPTDTQAPPTEVVPSDTPRPRPTVTPAPPTNTPRPQMDFRVVEQRLMNKADNGAQNHMILLRVVDAGGSPLPGLLVWDPSHPEQEVETGTKPEPYHGEYLFWNYDGYQLEVKGARSEKTKVLSTDVFKIPIEDLVTAGYCPDANSCSPGELVQHFCWYVTFQRTW
jgi:hypothetical protein